MKFIPQKPTGAVVFSVSLFFNLPAIVGSFYFCPTGIASQLFNIMIFYNLVVCLLYSLQFMHVNLCLYLCTHNLHIESTIPKIVLLQFGKQAGNQFCHLQIEMRPKTPFAYNYVSVSVSVCICIEIHAKYKCTKSLQSAIIYQTEVITIIIKFHRVLTSQMQHVCVFAHITA